MRLAKLLPTALLLAAACGPGRQAAWERESSDKMASPPSGQTEAADANAEAEAAWADRGNRESLEKAIAAWEKVVEANPGNGAALTSLSRAYYLLADGFMRGEEHAEEMLATYEKGILAGENAMMGVSEDFAGRVKGGEKVEQAVSAIPATGQGAIYWYSSNLGKFAVAKGLTTTLFYKDRIFAVMQHVLKVDETFYHGAPHRYFGAFYAKAPSFAGGDLNKSKEHFEKSLALAPDYFGTKVLFAQYYAVKAEDKELFDRLLKEVLEGDPTVIPELAVEQKIEQDKARELQASAAEYF